MVPARGKVAVRTGLSIAVPSGTYGRVAPRSGLAARHFIDVGAGVIDEDYRGELLVLLFNHSEADFAGAMMIYVQLLLHVFAAATPGCHVLLHHKQQQQCPCPSSSNCSCMIAVQATKLLGSSENTHAFDYLPGYDCTQLHCVLPPPFTYTHHSQEGRPHRPAGSGAHPDARCSGG